MNSESNVGDVVGWLFGLLFSAIGLVNIFWGNDPFFGVLILVLSFIYLPPINILIKRKTGFKIPVAVKIILGVFIAWASLGVGELFDKIELMMKDF